MLSNELVQPPREALKFGRCGWIRALLSVARAAFEYVASHLAFQGSTETDHLPSLHCMVESGQLQLCSSPFLYVSSFERWVACQGLSIPEWLSEKLQNDVQV